MGWSRSLRCNLTDDPRDPPCAAATVPRDGWRCNTENAMDRKLNVLFLCTGNSCRSQMAEGWARHLKGNQINAYSAGVSPHGMNASAVRVMKEAGVDISGHSSKHLDVLADVAFD